MAGSRCRHTLHEHDHEREEGEICKGIRGAAIRCLEVPEALAECESTLAVCSSLQWLAVSTWTPARACFSCVPLATLYFILRVYAHRRNFIALLPPKIAPDLVHMDVVDA